MKNGSRHILWLLSTIRRKVCSAQVPAIGLYKLKNFFSPGRYRRLITGSGTRESVTSQVCYPEQIGGAQIIYVPPFHNLIT